jgi:hypothetical protein
MTDDSQAEFERARLSIEARFRAAEVRAILQRDAPDLVEDVAAIEEGGISLGYESTIGREIVFLIPAKIKIGTPGGLYFIARGTGFRRAGIILESDLQIGISSLVRWGTGAEADLSAEGLDS